MVSAPSPYPAAQFPGGRELIDGRDPVELPYSRH
jgi:hypothetical protein